MARRRSRKPRAPRKVAYTLLAPESHAPEYRLLDVIVSAHHREIKAARIALAWCTSWRRDVDGRIKLTQCKRASDLDRELKPYDFVILLQKDFWIDVNVGEAQRVALLDHALCYASVKLDPYTHEPLTDERGRTVYRIRKPDVIEFAEIVERHGTYTRDLELFAQAIYRAANPEQPDLPMKPTHTTH